MKSHQQYYTALAGLRGIGAIWVTSFHLFHQSSNQIIKSGYLGVDLFFLLSGFIITHVHQGDFRTGYDVRTHVHFLKLRLARIYPLHLVIILAFGFFVMLAPDFIARYPRPERFGLNAFVATLLLVHNWGFGPATLWNLPTWSLSAEWLAYLLFPFAAIGVSKIRPAYSLLAALCLLAVLELIFLKFGHREDGGKPGLLRLAFEFLAGCLVCQSVREGGRQPRALCGIAIALLLVAIFVPGMYFFASTSFALLIVTVVSGPSRLSAALACAPMSRLGDLSFSLYLCHWPLIQIRNWAVEKDYLGADAGFALLVMAIIASTWVCWTCVEKPGRDFARRHIAPPPEAQTALPSGPDAWAQEKLEAGPSTK